MNLKMNMTVTTSTTRLRSSAVTLLAASMLTLSAPGLAADLPGTGIKMQGLQNTIAEGTFQTLLVNRALVKLGYDVQATKEITPVTAHVAIANGDATFMADHWDPLHTNFYTNAGGDAKLSMTGVYSDNSAQGYLIDKASADKYNITNISQMADPKIAKLFDNDGDGTADMTGCDPGWGCEEAIEHHLTAYKLRGHVTHKQGNYAALIADTLVRYKEGKPVFYYTWTPYWVSAVMKPGIDVVWLEVPFSSLPGSQKQVETKLPNGKNYGFVVNQQKIVANKLFVEANPATAKLFEVMKLSSADINAQNMRMNQGEDSMADIERHTDAWISSHQALFDGWIAQAMTAAKQ
jgi:glycine betaine/proline transport system substrate-binding protein